ncbi:hypothetical protein MTR67_012121 [Solanum verrucosum]|uniref:Uncharacterized protein n=1 Tax=Solanum verrucosum TaxID=315347 RepID=A0AAF0Q8C6_SOLVR|nr:hypothetical protein MTR67_012121 [Solanum verrucosum]
MKTYKKWIYLDCGRRPNLHRWNMIFEIRKVRFLFRSSPVRATPSSISSCVLFHLTLYFASMLLSLGWSTKILLFCLEIESL